MPRTRVIPYRQGSKSAKDLATSLNGLCLRIDGTSRFRPRQDDLIINWGNTNLPEQYRNNLNVLNSCDLRQVSNKRTFFETLSETCPNVLPTFWTNSVGIPEERYPIVCRTVLAGHSGEGIVIANTPEELVEAPLYTQYIKKQNEYRIHLGKLSDGRSTVISIQRKGRRLDCENPNWQVRNHSNGFIYMRENCTAPEQVLSAAMEVFRNTSLDFGAIDVIFNSHYSVAYVLEINTAPGLEGQTLIDYTRFFRGLQHV